ncbi:hypothetical protein [Amycolatopsis sp. PS_44_ISF1]|uniref:hypothetical protein n=1 Tax=Amycolatopsis sp. PS_44_ISF1 TaxID=2974917 RepID=UPI0028DDB41E|nr:hypothetical protein [Amycolatopsis sp. PS_44_ISF1]MDT8915249.1 hypothetical protein [Amycolatopsis sp. PS_44_ISF1]
MSTEPDRRESATGIDRVAHAFCPRCHPDPRPGEVLVALCGARYPFWGRRADPVSTCEACRTLVSAPVLGCGHSG